MQPYGKFGTPLTDPVSSDAIEAAISAAWRAAAEKSDGSPSAHPPVRASVLTLVACVNEPLAVDGVLDAVTRLSRLHPSRTVILLPNAPAGTGELEVWTSTTSVVDLGYELAVSTEQIVVAARGHAPHHLPSLTDQLILPDLPSFLWWTGDLSADDVAFFGRLATLADRVIVDSAEFGSLGNAFARLTRLIQPRYPTSAFSDVSWTRLTPWRELLAQLFDSPALRGRPGELDRVVVEVDPGDRSGAAQALLLVGWLAACLGWGPGGNPLPVFVPLRAQPRRSDGRPVDLTIRLAAHPGAGGLARVELGAGGDATFVVTRDADGDHATTEMTLAGTPPVRRTVRLDPEDVSALLTAELMLFGRDRVYEKALLTIARLAGEQE